VFPASYESRNPALDGNLVHADSLRQQLQLLKKRYHVITPEDFLHWSEENCSEKKRSLPLRSVLLTCDDALRNTLSEMVPILQELGLSCLFFATGASAAETPSMLWYEELYLMLLDAGEPITLSLPEAGVGVGPIAPNEKHGVGGIWSLSFLTSMENSGANSWIKSETSSSFWRTGESPYFKHRRWPADFLR
jgi:hypothetical protein